MSLGVHGGWAGEGEQRGLYWSGGGWRGPKDTVEVETGRDWRADEDVTARWVEGTGSGEGLCWGAGERCREVELQVTTAGHFGDLQQALGCVDLACFEDGQPGGHKEPPGQGGNGEEQRAEDGTPGAWHLGGPEEEDQAEKEPQGGQEWRQSLQPPGAI